MTDQKDAKDQKDPDATVEAPAKLAAVEVEKSLPSRTLFTILNGFVNGGRPARVQLTVNGRADGKLNVSALGDEGEVLGTYEISEAGVKPL